MGFEVGTDWARFGAHTTGIIAWTLAMEGALVFFLESGLLRFGEHLFGEPHPLLLASLLVWIGAYVSGFVIIATEAWMPHPVDYTQNPDGTLQITGYFAILFNSEHFR